MPRARMPVTGYSPPALDLSENPFRVTDRGELEHLVRPLAVNEARFTEIIESLESHVALWRIERRSEVEPTRRQLLQSIVPIAQAARALADALAIARNPAEGSDPDPLAGDTSDFPWTVEDVFDAFKRHYDEEDAGKDGLTGADEAFGHLIELVPLLARAAAEHCRNLQATERINSAGRAPSANHRLFDRLVPVYEELFGRNIGRSRNPDSKSVGTAVPTGPAIRFFGIRVRTAAGRRRAAGADPRNLHQGRCPGKTRGDEVAGEQWDRRSAHFSGDPILRADAGSCAVPAWPRPARPFFSSAQAANRPMPRSSLSCGRSPGRRHGNWPMPQQRLDAGLPGRMKHDSEDEG